MKITKKSIFKNSVIFLSVIALTVSCIIFSASADKIDETNPELILAKIDSDVENTFYSEGIYVQKTDFNQGGGKYNLLTNSYVAWSDNDDIAFAYKKYNVSENKGDYMEATVTIDSVPTVSPATGELHRNASAGLMFRSGLNSDDAEAFIHVRTNSILAVYRTKKGNGTSVQYTGMTVKFPVQLKMVKKANSVTLSYKSEGGDWMNFKYPIGLNAKGPLYVGLAAHSCDEVNFINANFSNFTLQGVGTYDGSDDPGGNESETESEYIEEDSPVAGNVIMRETFTDGSLTNKPASVTNPVWEEPEEFTLLNENGNRVWDRTFIDQNDYVGDAWTDYEASVDVKFSEKCNPDPKSASNTFRLLARHTGIEFYGHSAYAATVTNGYKITLYKQTFIKNDPSVNGYALSETVNLRDVLNDENYSCLGDGKYHNLKIRVFDNKITVYWDGKEVIYFEDTGISEKSTGQRVFPKGNVGISTLETACYVDNLTVVKLEDTFGGDYDNHIGGNWDLPVPDYITEWEAKGY